MKLLAALFALEGAAAFTAVGSPLARRVSASRSTSPVVVESWYDEGKRLDGTQQGTAPTLPPPPPPPPLGENPFVSSARSGWDIRELSPDRKLVQRVEGKTRKTWKFADPSLDRVQVALTSAGRPANADIQLWLGPDWTPFTCKMYSEDAKARPIQTLIGTRNKAAMVEVRNNGEEVFPLEAASNYANEAMAQIPHELPATIEGERVDGGAIRSYIIDPSTEQVEVVLDTDGKQLNARLEVLNAPNNPKQTFECFTNNGHLNSLVVCVNTPDLGNTIRIVNLAPVEFPCYVYLRPMM
mmetsp:Transcript_4581/g.12167  ORF Transcript_4581/g.12167 Transcript_4581/m.12167 type:complete len:297 (-) Transcript_4581:468-1358(-)